MSLLAFDQPGWLVGINHMDKTDGQAILTRQQQGTTLCPLGADAQIGGDEEVAHGLYPSLRIR